MLSLKEKIAAALFAIFVIAFLAALNLSLTVGLVLGFALASLSLTFLDLLEVPAAKLTLLDELEEEWRGRP